MIIYEDIFREFQKHRVKYIIVGGIAVNLLGYMRTTADLDILVEMKDANLAKIVNILKKHGYHIKQPIDPISIVDKHTREDWGKNRHMKAINFYKEKELKEVNIIIKSTLSYEIAKKKLKKIKVGNIALPVISAGNLIKMKRKSGRDIDKIDIKMLEKINKLRRGK